MAGLAVSRVNGSNRVPRPAARIMAFTVCPPATKEHISVSSLNTTNTREYPTAYQVLIPCQISGETPENKSLTFSPRYDTSPCRLSFQSGDKPLIFLLLIVYFIGMIGIGLTSARKIRRIESFFVADRQGSSLLISGSLLATIVGGSSTIGMAGKGFSWGLVGAWWMLVGVVGLLLLFCFLAKRIRDYGLFTLPELLEGQYGGSAKTVASVVIIWAWVGIIAGQIAASGQVLNTLVPGNLSLMMALSAAVFIVYTILGGQISILRTDTVQSVIMIAGILLCSYFSLQQIGGITAMKSHLPPDCFRFPVNSSFSWKNLAEWLVLIGSAYLVGPDIYSRLFSSRDGETARKSVLLAALTLVPLAFAVTLIGMSARILNPSLAGEEAFPYMIQEVLPWGINALVMAALLCALMSSADTVLLTSSTIFSVDITNDLVTRIRDKGLDDRTLLLLSRLAVILFGLVALGFAVKFRGVIRLLLLGYSIYTAGIVVPVAFGFSVQKLRLHPKGAIIAMVGGGGWVVFGSTALFERLGLGKLLPLSPGFEGVLLSLVLLFGGSYVFRLRRKTPTAER
jgi:SSS family solute:Na+ symporter